MAELKFNADRVVLSQCSAAVTHQLGADALSSVLFYAGARAVCGDTSSIARTFISTLDGMTTAGLGRAEALRRAMIEFMNDTTDPRNNNLQHMNRRSVRWRCCWPESSRRGHV